MLCSLLPPFPNPGHGNDECDDNDLMSHMTTFASVAQSWLWKQQDNQVPGTNDGRAAAITVL